MELNKFIKAVPKGIWAVSMASLLVAISTSMTFSISPLFMKDVLGISLFAMGMMEGISEALSQASKLFSGVIGDISKRKKPILLSGFILAAISKPFFILAPGAGMVMFSKLLERMSNGLMASPRDAYVANEAPLAIRGRCLGLMMSLKTLGCTLGSWLIAFMLLFTTNYRTLLWIGLIPCTLAIFIIVFYLIETDKSPEPEHEKIKLSFKAFKHLPNAYWFLLIVASTFMAARISDGFLIIRLQSLGASKAVCASIIGTFNLISAISCLPIGQLSDKYSRQSMLYIAFIALVACHIAFAFATNVYVGFLGVILWGAQRGSSQLLFSAAIADCVPKNMVGTAIGFFNVVTGLIAIVVGGVVGMMADSAIHFPFLYGAFVASTSLILLGLNGIKSLQFQDRCINGIKCMIFYTINIKQLFTNRNKTR